MSRREEELIRCAFGDLEPREAEEIRRRCQVDPKTARELADYETMREGLKQLRDIPEMQLSRERLKDAILRDGLKPTRTASWWERLSWPMAIAATAAAAFLVVVRMKGNDAPLPLAASGGAPVTVALEKPDLSSPQGALDAELKMDYLSIEKNPLAMNFTREAPAVPTTLDTDPEPKRETRPLRRRLDRTVVAAKEKAEEPAAMSAAAAPEFDSGAPERDQRPAAVASMPEDKGIVVIDSTPAESGTQRAVEVEAASNVLVGG